MINNKLVQVSLVIENYDEAIDFYVKKLGFQLIEDSKLSEEKRWVVVSPGDANECCILLAKAANDEQQSRIGNQTGGRVFLFLHTDNFEGFYKRIISNNINVLNGPRDEVYGKVLVFEDLYGNKWDLIQPNNYDTIKSNKTLEIKKVKLSEIHIVRDIAHKAWPSAYETIISNSQIDFMLKMMYDIDTLSNQIEQLNHQIFFLYSDNIPIGFISFEHGYNQTSSTKIHKLYLLPETKGKGYGKLLLDFVLKRVKEENLQSIILNVNKKNPSFHFYKKSGFEIMDEVVLDIGNGYVMDDYVMKLEV